MNNPNCDGNHAVDGPDGCGDEACRGRTFCVATCEGCPGNFNPACRGEHAVDGDGGCGNDACRGKSYCAKTCTTCPDAA
ncbi:MAG: hypothetical protein U0271_43330 [Polyangiaceae bacterium]